MLVGVIVQPSTALIDAQRISICRSTPYMRGRMSDRESYAAQVELGSVMVGAQSAKW
jgi:NADPH-dependent curcumin reductase CurA